MKQRGFTLIELLTAISIIGFLSAIIIVNLSSARQKARIAAGKQFEASIKHGLGSELVGEWNLDEAAGPALDSSGYNRDGAWMAPPINPSTACVGSENCYEFPPTGGYLEIGDYSHLDPGTSDWTVSGWVKETAVTAADIVLVGKRNGDGWAVVMRTANRRLHGYFDAIPGASSRVCVIGAKRSFPVNEWHHFAVVFDRDASLSLYRDGEYIGSDIDGGKCTPATDPFLTDHTGSLDTSIPMRVGQGDPLGTAFTGYLDNIKIYRAALKLAQIKEDYERGLVLHQNFALK